MIPCNSQQHSPPFDTGRCSVCQQAPYLSLHPKCSLPCTYEPTICPYAKQDEPSRFLSPFSLRHILTISTYYP